MVRQRQYQQPTNGGAGSKAPLLILGAAALMIQGLLVLPTPANAETTINISSNSNNNDNNNNNNSNNSNGASVVANSGNSKVTFDMGVHHNLQTIASLSTGGSGPGGAGPQLWGTTSAAVMVSHSNNATAPANLQQEQQQKDVLEGASLALYRKIRLEETSDAPAAAVDSTTSVAATAKDVGVMEEMENIQSGETEPAVEDGLENEVASAEKETVSRNTDANTTDTKKKDDNKDVTAIAVVDEDSLSVILSPVSSSTLSTAANDDKKKSKKIIATELEDEKKADDYGDDEDVQNDKTTIATDETESETETEIKTEAVDGNPRVGDQVVLVKDVTLEREAEKKATDKSSAENHEDAATATVGTTADATTYNKESKSLKPEEDGEEEEEEEVVEEEGGEEEEEGEGKEDLGDKKDEKGKKGEEDNAEDDKDADETKDQATTMVLDGGKKKVHRKQAFARLREQLVKQQQQQQQLSTGETDTTEAPTESDQTADVTTPMAEDVTATLARAADFVPPEDMRAVMDAKAKKDKMENKKTLSPLTPQQIADTEHQGANAFFELFAADVFPDVKLVGNNQLQDLDFEQRLNKQKEDKKAKAAKKKQQQDKKDKKDKKKVANKKDKKKVTNKKDKKKVANKKGGMKQQQHRHQHEKRALPAAAPEMTEKERVHAVLESIFGKDGAAKIEAEADDSSDVKITAQGHDKGIFATTDATDAKVAKKNHHKKKPHHKHHAKAAAENHVASIFTADAKDTKDNKLTPFTDSPMSKPIVDGPPQRTIPGSSAGQPQPQQGQTKQPDPGTASPASPPADAPPAGAKGGPAAPSKGETGTAGFGTVPMFGPAQLDLGNSAASLIASKSSIALALVFGVAWMVL